MYDARMDQNAAPDSSAVRLTYDDFLLLPDDGQRHEIIDGQHFVTPSPNLRHQVVIGRFHFHIESFLRQHRDCGCIFLSPFDVVFTRWDVVEPDLVFVAGDQQQILTAANVQGAPALVIEVLSPGTRRTDQGEKLRLFDRGGTREYWMADPIEDVVTVFRRDANGAFPKVATLTAAGHEVLSTPLMPGLTIAVSELFADR